MRTICCRNLKIFNDKVFFTSDRFVSCEVCVCVFFPGSFAKITCCQLHTITCCSYTKNLNQIRKITGKNYFLRKSLKHTVVNLIGELNSTQWSQLISLAINSHTSTSRCAKFVKMYYVILTGKSCAIFFSIRTPTEMFFSGRTSADDTFT